MERLSPDVALQCSQRRVAAGTGQRTDAERLLIPQRLDECRPIDRVQPVLRDVGHEKPAQVGALRVVIQPVAVFQRNELFAVTIPSVTCPTEVVRWSSGPVLRSITTSDRSRR